ncbi:MAG: bifunctional methylenetetrahydrofolate dehydrogenase/methenyltetrahydrofolate cyclohydrolase [Elusimicrobiota bacterium]
MRIENFNSIFGKISSAKVWELKEKIERMKINLGDIEEKFVKGGGKGGQKINKTNNAVVLKYKPLAIVVRCQKDRSLSVNRFLALRELISKIEKVIFENVSVVKSQKKRGIYMEGKTLAEKINQDTKKMSEEFYNRTKRKPFIAIINYFEDSPSSYYMNLKIKKCNTLGIDTRVYMPEDKKDKKGFISLIKSLGNDRNVDAIMVEKPLPDGFDDVEFWDTLNPKKDVDALSSVNMGRLFITRNFLEIEKEYFFVPQTAYAVIKLMKYHNIEISGKKVVVCGRSSIVGKPVAHMLTLLDATVTICHSKTRNLTDYLKSADIIVSAIGKARFIKADMVGEGQVIIDVGTNIDENGKICGDVDFENVKNKTSFITPVPGGVGPVTLACLLNATVKAAQNLL